ncbi:MAG: FAD binding domain-containing protein [Thermincola sp.]|jgi:CO/xanthine dehydrogenase FAD-binding subunit|nr:FAD binding domain-containing protein [Thermincola sp.]MDT3701857.1 FAD binding domain-containing protein [Thermincola sp.]
MFTLNHYLIAESLEQAYELNQNKANAILGGILWLKMGGRTIDTGIDLSGLGLNRIEETDDYFRIGCMVTLRDLETHPGIKNCFHDFFSMAFEHIVGVQFRNGATIGGSIYARFAFSDVLTAMLALDTKVELYQGGIIPLAQYVDIPPDRDILVRIILQKKHRNAVCLSHRLSATDLPVITCAVSNGDGLWKIVLGARPGRAKLTEFKLAGYPDKADIEQWITQVYETVEFGSNSRGSKEYRHHLAGVMMKRCIALLASGGSYEN